MSKSAENEMSRIHLLDDPDVIAIKIKRAKTDTFDGFEFDNPERPECKNLLSMYQIMTGKSQAARSSGLLPRVHNVLPTALLLI
eukprot:scaffold81960_cov21-Prasinocladus_malaysianus.AAC.2